MEKNVKSILEEYQEINNSYTIEEIQKFIGRDVIVTVLGKDNFFLVNEVLKEVTNNLLVFETCQIDYVSVYNIMVSPSMHNKDSKLLQLPKSDPSVYTESTYNLIEHMKGKVVNYIIDGVEEFGFLLDANEEYVTIKKFVQSTSLLDFLKTNSINTLEEFEDSSLVYKYNVIKNVRELIVDDLLKLTDCRYLYNNCKITLRNHDVIYAYIVDISIYNVEFNYISNEDQNGNVYVGSVVTSDIKSIELI